MKYQMPCEGEIEEQPSGKREKKRPRKNFNRFISDDNYHRYLAISNILISDGISSLILIRNV